MPYSGPDDPSLPDHVKDRPENIRAQWVETWTSVKKECEAKGGKDCEGEAFKQANGVINMQTLVFHKAKSSPTRREILDGVVHLVVPVVALVAGVLNGELVTPEEASAHFDAWNGRPVVMNHPEQDGIFISANDPQILKELSFGRMFNTDFDGKNLKAEMWIPLKETANRGGDFAEAIKRFEKGELVEVSTAYMRDVEQKTGSENGQDFETIAHNIRPDHLAVLLHEPGACSIADGCGAPRVNSELELAKADFADYEKYKKLEVNMSGDFKSQIMADARFGLSVDNVAGLDENVAALLAKFIEDNPLAGDADIEDELEDIEEEIIEEDELEDMAKDEEEDEEKSPATNSTIKQDFETMRSMAGGTSQDQFADFGGTEAALLQLAELKTNADKRKKELVNALITNDACVLSERQLSDMDIATLDAVQASLIKPDYTGQGGGGEVVANANKIYEQPSMFGGV